MNASVDKNAINRLYKVVSKWQNTKARSEEGVMDYEEYESGMDEYLATLEDFENRGVRKIGEGRDRITFTGGELVDSRTSVIIKISKSGGAAQNNKEIGLWKKMDNKTKKHVAWLVNWDDRNRWIVQERVSQLAKPNATKKVIEHLESNGWVCSDVRPENVGKREKTGNSGKRPKKPVLVDLGVGLRRK